MKKFFSGLIIFLLVVFFHTPSGILSPDSLVDHDVPIKNPDIKKSPPSEKNTLEVVTLGRKSVFINNKAAQNIRSLKRNTGDVRVIARNVLKVLDTPEVCKVLRLKAPQKQLQLINDRSNRDKLRFMQTINGVGVYGAEVIVKLASKGNIERVVSHLRPGLKVDTRPGVSVEQARAIALNHYLTIGAPQEKILAKDAMKSIKVHAPRETERTEKGFKVIESTLFVVPRILLGVNKVNEDFVLAYCLDVQILKKGDMADLVRYWVKAVKNSKVLRRYSILIDATKELKTYHANNITNILSLSQLLSFSKLKKHFYEGTLDEDVPPYPDPDNNEPNPVVEDAHLFTSNTYNYFFEKFQRDSFSANGAVMKAFVHIGINWNNACWSPTLGVTLYGDGDGEYYYPLAGSPEVVAHEWTHAVTSYEANLEYVDQSGAMNESMSDVFGKFVEFYAGGSTDDWRIGDEIVGPSFTGNCLRDMEDPTLGEPFSSTADNQPDHMEDYFFASYDDGGVHTNSGILNKAAFLLAAGGTHHGVTVNPIGIDNAEKLYYKALTEYLAPTSQFWHLRNAMEYGCSAIASDLTLPTSQCLESVSAAFDAVGITYTFISDPERHQYIPVTSSDTHYPIKGSVPPSEFGETLISWTLEYAPAGTSSYTNIFTSNYPIVPDTILCNWNMLTVPEGRITLQLRAEFSNHISVFKIPIYLDAMLMEGWPVDVDQGAQNLTMKSPKIADLDKDGQNELVFGAAVFKPNGLIKNGWNNIPGPGRSNPAIANIDDDNELEVIVVEYDELGGYNPSLPNKGGPVVYAYEHDKTQIWSYDIVNLNFYKNRGSVSTIAVADVDGDNELEAVFTYYTTDNNPNENTDLFVLDAATGTQELRKSLSGISINSVALADFDADGASEIVVSTERKLYVLKGDGTDYTPAWPYDLDQATFWIYGKEASPVVGDVNQDGNYEIFLIKSLWNHDDGTLYNSGWPINYRTYNGVLVPLPDDEPELELFVKLGHWYVYLKYESNGTQNGIKYSLGENSRLQYTFSSGALENPVSGAPTVADIDGDCEPETITPAEIPYVFYDRPQILYGGEPDDPGATPTGFPRYMPSEVNIMSTPTVGDLNGDGKVDVAIGAGGKIFVWEMGKTYNEGGNPWPMFGYDLNNTNTFSGWAKHGEPYGILTHQSNYNSLLHFSGAAVMSMIIDSLNGSDDAPAQTSFSQVPPTSGYTAEQVKDILDNYNYPLPDNFGWFRSHSADRAEVLYQIAYWHDKNGIAAAVPFMGDYSHWVAIEGVEAAAAPSCADMSIYSLKGVWIDDPGPGGGKSFKTAAELNNTYFLPTNNGEFEAVIEPPKKIGTVTVLEPSKRAFPKATDKCLNAAALEHAQRCAIEGIKEFRLTSNTHFYRAYKDTEVGKPVFVRRTDGGANYYLVRFDRWERDMIISATHTPAAKTLIKRPPRMVKMCKAIVRIADITGQLLEVRYKIKGSLDYPRHSCSLQWSPSLAISPFQPVEAGTPIKEPLIKRSKKRQKEEKGME